MNRVVCCIFIFLFTVNAAGNPVRSDEPATSAASTIPGQRLLIVVGANGTEEYGTTFRSWSDRWKAAAERATIEHRLIGIDLQTAESSTTDLETLKQTLSEWTRTETREPLWIVLIGHGTFDQKSASFNLRGPDLSAGVMAELCKDSRCPLAVICCFSCSAPFLNSLSAPERVIVTATKDGNQIQYSRFGDAMSLAIAGLDADTDRDGQTSLMEAWLFASRRTAEFYAEEGRLATEHSLLDDNGDGRGSRCELFEGRELKPDVKEPQLVDRQLSSRWHLIRSSEELSLTSEQREKRDEFELKLAELRTQKDSLPEEEYLNKLQELLVPLAQLYKEAGETEEKSATPVSEPAVSQP